MTCSAGDLRQTATCPGLVRLKARQVSWLASFRAFLSTFFLVLFQSRRDRVSGRLSGSLDRRQVISCTLGEAEGTLVVRLLPRRQHRAAGGGRHLPQALPRTSFHLPSTWRAFDTDPATHAPPNSKARLPLA